MSDDYWAKKDLSNKFSFLERRLTITSKIKDKRKKNKELLKLRSEVKLLLKENNKNKFDNNFLFKDFSRKVGALILSLEKEYAKE